MIDGISADAFDRHAADLPTLHALASRGLHVDRLASSLPATSLPGRTGIVTGVSPVEHGIYGNTIHDGERFRYATPDDVRVPTLPRRARDFGRSVAVLGYGMIRPEDATTFVSPWWVSEMIQRGRDAEPIPASHGWLRTLEPRDEHGALGRLDVEVRTSDLPDPYTGDRSIYLLTGVEADRRMVRMASRLAAAADGPDLLLAEVLVPDSVQHVAGEGHPYATWSMAYADALVATLLDELERSGRRDDTNVVVVSDHGHGAVERAFYPERILPDVDTAPEGGTLFVAVSNEAHLREVSERLAEHGIEPYAAPPFPPDVAERLAAFAAPERAAFERAPEGGDPEAVSGPPGYPSTHGLKPGTASDDRFFVAAGPDIPRAHVPHAEADAVEATLADLVGLAPAGTGRSLAHSQD